MPTRFFKEYPGGESSFRRIIERLNYSDVFKWGNTIASIPKQEVPYCYLVFGGKVQYRTEILEYERNKTMTFYDGGIERVFTNKNWIWLRGPVERAPRQIPMRGFQGFRYCDYLF